MQWMRALFFLLVLVNAVLFAWGQGYFGARNEGREPHRLQDQLQPEKLKVAPLAPVAPAPRQACRQVEGLTQADAERIATALQADGAGLTATVAAPEEPGYWVSIGALPNKAAADKKAGELRQMGVNDFHVIQGDGGSFAISLGVSATEAGANELLQKVIRKGVRSARVDQHPVASTTATLEARGAEDALNKRLADLLTGTTATVTDCK